MDEFPLIYFQLRAETTSYNRSLGASGAFLYFINVHEHSIVCILMSQVSWGYNLGVV